MKYEKEYPEFVKQITDKYISLTSGECPSKTWSGNNLCDDMFLEPTEKEIMEFHKQKNKIALLYLNENIITYNEWLIKYKK